jgi:hypothetical protein
MNIGVHFPSDAEVIAEEAERFAGLPADDRISVIRSLLEAGALMLRNSPRSSYLQEYAAEQERASHQSVREFLKRHAASS